MSRKILLFLIFVGLTFVLCPAFAGTGGIGKSHTIQVNQKFTVNSSIFDNLVQGYASYEVYCHGPYGCSQPQGSQGMWLSPDKSIDRNSFDYEYYGSLSAANWNTAVSLQSVVDQALSFYTNLFHQTGQAPTSDELATFMNNALGYNSANAPSLQSLTDWAENTASQAGRNWWSSLSQSTGTSSSSAIGSFNPSTAIFQQTRGNSVMLVSGHGLVGTTIQNIRSLSGNLSAGGNLTTYTVNYQQAVSPLVLDMSGSGRLEASGGNWLPHPGTLYTNRMVLFDLKGDGFPMIMEWVGPDDGLLVKLAPSQIKPDGTAVITGDNLFGTMGGFANGFEKLATLDKNHDGKLTGDELNGLYVWQDENGDGIVEPGELKSVQSLGITEIDITHNSQMVGSFVRNGKRYTMWDWYPNAMEVLKHKP
jgi:hypothetical protein